MITLKYKKIKLKYHSFSRSAFTTDIHTIQDFVDNGNFPPGKKGRNLGGYLRS